MRRVVGGLVALACVLAACTAQSGSHRSPSTRPSAAALTAAERLYGQAPGEPGPKLQYQPDVIRVGGGPAAVKGVSGNGLTFTIDGRAAHAAEIAPGRILYASGRVVGRILAVRDVAGNKAVTLGPVSLTELYRKLDFKIERPVSIANVTKLPYPSDAVTLGSAPAPRGTRSAAHRTLTTPVVRFAAVTGSSPYSIDTACCGGGVSLNAGYYKDGTAINLKARFFYTNPRVTAYIKIAEDGKPLQAALQISGGAGIHLGFTASSSAGANVHDLAVEVPVDLSLPLYALGVPAAFTFTQRFSLQTAFSARNSSLSASGDWGFHGSLGFYYDGHFSVQTPRGFAPQNSFLQSVQGISVGIESLVFGYTARAYVGVGPLGFTSGVYFGLVASVTALRQSNVVLRDCRQVTVKLDAIVGIGWTVPKVLVSILNAILSVFKVEPLPSYGGTPPYTLSVVPQQVASQPAGCAGRS